jgi:hypothetical protein
VVVMNTVDGAAWFSFILVGDIRARFEESGQKISVHPKFIPAGHAAICAPINDICER